MTLLDKIPIVYYSLYALYYVMSTVFSDVPVIGPVCWLIVTFISFVIIGYALFEVKKSLYIIVTFLGIIYFSIYGVYLILSGDVIVWGVNGHIVDNKMYLFEIFSAFLPILSTYAFKKLGWIQENFMRFFFVFFLVVSVIVFYDFYQKQLMLAAFMRSSRTEFTNETSYLFLALFPLIVLFDSKKIMQFVFLICILIFEIVSFKRGVLVVGILNLFYFYRYVSQSQTFGEKKQSYLLIFFLCIFVGLFCYNEFLSSEYFQKRVLDTLDGSSSGRDEIYGNLLSHFWNETSILEFFWGNGANGTLNVSKTYAHNDWLAILTEQGFFGVLLFSIYWCVFFAVWRMAKDEKCRFVIGCCFIASLGKSMFSMYYLPVSPNMQFSSFLSCVILGYFLAETEVKNYSLTLDMHHDEKNKKCN